MDTDAAAPALSRRLHKPWQISVRELVLFTAVVGMALGYWNAVKRSRYTASPFYQGLVPMKLIHDEANKLGIRRVTGGGGGGGDGTYNLKIYQYTLSTDADSPSSLPVSQYVSALESRTRSELTKNDCSVQGRHRSMSNKGLIGFGYDYRWQTTRGWIDIRSHKCNANELLIVFMIFECGPP